MYIGSVGDCHVGNYHKQHLKLDLFVLKKFKLLYKKNLIVVDKFLCKYRTK